MTGVAAVTETAEAATETAEAVAEGPATDLAEEDDPEAAEVATATGNLN